MAKIKIQYSCTHCAAVHNKWAGQCGDCGQWNCLEESVVQPTSPAAAKSSRFSTYAGDVGGKKIQKLGNIEFQQNIRTSTQIKELDRVLGGGLVTGSVVLIGGDPGIGKSTLMLQVTATMPENIKTLYVTGEESLSQISMRATRLELEADELECMAETSVEAIIGSALVHKPNLMVIDSIQTLYTENLTSIPGSISQVKECAAQLVRFAKQNNTSIIFVGHVTKEGGIAGPRVLEHMVDTVLYFESDGNSRYRILRALKNRFGAVNEIGVFAMTEKGVQEVENPSAIFLSEHSSPQPGSVVMVTREGTRPLLIEVQALADQSPLGNPRRLTVGLDPNRLAMLLAVLHRMCQLAIHDHDIYMNVVGGMKVTETAADLAIIMAVVSSFRNRYLPKGTIVFGEVGLTGEIRPVFNGEDRLKEAANHGFTHAIVPKGNIGAWTKGLDIKVTGVDNINQILDYI
jgi:DNA repair protein RadA/Sms